MNARLAAAALLVMLAIVLGFRGKTPVSIANAGDDVQLVAEQIGDYRRTAETWRNPHPAGPIEEGAMYVAAAGSPVQLDFYRRDPQPHNGLACYLLQGETLLRDHIVRLPTRDGAAEFELGLAQTRESLRVVAATECRAGGCSEIALPIWHGLANFKHLLPQLLEPRPAGAVVPMSIVITAHSAEYDPSIEADLMQQLKNFTAGLDLAPARRLAALQGGQANDATAIAVSQRDANTNATTE